MYIYIHMIALVSGWIGIYAVRIGITVVDTHNLLWIRISKIFDPALILDVDMDPYSTTNTKKTRMKSNLDSAV